MSQQTQGWIRTLLGLMGLIVTMGCSSDPEDTAPDAPTTSSRPQLPPTSPQAASAKIHPTNANVLPPSSTNLARTSPPVTNALAPVNSNPPPRLTPVATPTRQSNAAPAATRSAAPAAPNSSGRQPGRPASWSVAATRLNVREGPGTRYRALGVLAQGEGVRPLAVTTDPGGNKWYRISSNSGQGAIEGWVHGDYLSRQRQSTPREPADPNRWQGNFRDLYYRPVPKTAYPGNPPRQVKGLYVTMNTLSSVKFDQLLKIVSETQINALVIDYKDDLGNLLRRSTVAERYNPTANSKAKYQDLSALMQKLKSQNIYTIARVVTFKDPLFANTHPQKAILDRQTGMTYQSRDRLKWASPFDRDFQAYNIGVATEAAKAGFNEIQFDYVRFPDVSSSRKLDFRTTSTASRAKVIQQFLLAARQHLAPLQVYIAADVFGLTTTTRDDMRIGQFWEAVSNAVDYICPMMYPSHYGKGNYGLEIPDQHPHAIIDRGIRDALRRNRNLETPAGLRPWLQGFTAPWVKGYRNYGIAEVKEQIRALSDNGVHSYLIWNPSNRYELAAYR